MSGERPIQGLLDTNILIMRAWIDPAELPDEMAISAITLAELSAGPHEVRRNDEQDSYDEHAERARRLEILQRAESEFDPVPFGARGGPHLRPRNGFGRRRWPQAEAQDRRPDDRIDRDGGRSAAYTTNPGDFAGMDALVRVMPVDRPPVPRTNGQPANRTSRVRYPAPIPPAGGPGSTGLARAG